MSQQDKIERMVQKIEKALEKYDETDTIGSWAIAFPVGVSGIKRLMKLRMITTYC